MRAARGRVRHRLEGRRTTALNSSPHPPVCERYAARLTMQPFATSAPLGLQRLPLLSPAPGSEPRARGGSRSFIGSDVAVRALGTGDAALVRRRTRRVITGVDRRAAGQKGVGLGRAAVVGQGPDLCVAED